MRGWGHSIAALCALLCAAPGCQSEPVPAALIHVWRTDAPAYRDRHLEIQSEWLVFGTGGYGSESYPIVGLESEPGDGASTRYTIHYQVDDGSQLELRLLLTHGTPDSLRIEHTDEVWRAEPASAPANRGA